MVHAARTTLIQKHYSNHVPEGMEQLIGAKLEHLFTDIKIQEDIAVSVFIFDRNIEYGTEVGLSSVNKTFAFRFSLDFSSINMTPPRT